MVKITRWKKPHILQFKLNKSLFLLNTFENLSMSTSLFKQRSCGTAKFRKDLFNMPLQQLAPGKVQLAYPASKYVLSLYLSTRFPFHPLLSINFPFFPHLPAPVKLSAWALSWAPGMSEPHTRVTLPLSLLRTPTRCPSSVRYIDQAPCVSLDHDCRSKKIKTGCLRGRKETQDIEVQFLALERLQESHLVFTCISLIQLCMGIVIVYLHLAYSVHSG